MKWEKHTCKIQECIKKLFHCKIKTTYFTNKQWSNFVTKRSGEQHLRCGGIHVYFSNAQAILSGIISNITGHGKHK